MQKETWKPIFDGLYSISTLGNVRAEAKTIPIQGFLRNKKYPRKPMKHFNNGKGYRYFTISVNGERKNAYIHIMVATAFIKNPNSLPEVNHKDGDKGNNNKKNLEWCTRSGNVVHALEMGLTKKGAAHPQAKKVLEISTGVIYISVRSVSEKVGSKYKTVKAALGYCKRFGGNYKGFQYA